MENTKNCVLFRRVRSERGSSDMDTVFILIVAVAVMSVGYIVLEWVKGIKDARVQHNIDMHEKNNAKKVEFRRGPSGYQVRF